MSKPNREAWERDVIERAAYFTTFRFRAHLVPMSGLGIGQQKQWLARALAEGGAQ